MAFLAGFKYESLSNRSKITSSNSSSSSIVVTAAAVVFVVIGAEAAVVVVIVSHSWAIFSRCRSSSSSSNMTL